MREIKVGSKIKPYGICALVIPDSYVKVHILTKQEWHYEFDGEICVVDGLEDNYLYFRCDGLLGIYEAHRKQCRLLVKMRKCDFCNGEGLNWIDSNETVYSIDCPFDEMNLAKVPCKKCNGKGKVRV